ncbi:hypothetical protein [Mycobacterium sp. 236(2023)]|uniref:hypothetical protein n=1 Tax=Mycobacterium sp. 236(2023) TaxID=3038163 RepID=UPI002414E7AC|nr:hypothetical protein [Mycobacterium sp. 236(2023)]MDG4668629.1 hypothetical protein [Mycobacterium sp. 236(2023)]
MERHGQPLLPPEGEPHNTRGADDAGPIEWTSEKVRSDIAADPDVSLLASGFIGNVPVATAAAFRSYVENWMMGSGTVTEADGALIHDSYTERFIFPVVGMVGAEPVYALEGYGTFERTL